MFSGELWDVVMYDSSAFDLLFSATQLRSHLELPVSRKEMGWDLPLRDAWESGPHGT